jgi:hypothetical protein
MTDESLETADRTTSASPISLTPIFLGLLWLATSAWTARASYTGGEAPSGALGDAIGSVPSTVAATIFTSATIASAVGARFPRLVPRLLAGLGAGVGFGLLAVAGTRFGYGDGPSITLVALVIGAAGVVGGVAAALPHAVLEAGLWGTTWVLFAGVIFGVLTPQMLSMFGGGETATPAAQEAAQGWVALTQSAATGILAALHASTFLRNQRAGWGWYPVAAGLGGMILLAAEYLSRLGGSVLSDVVGGSAVVNLTDAARLRHAAIVLVVAALIGALRARRATPEYD